MSASSKPERASRGDGISAPLLVVLAFLAALAPFAIDMYLPAFPAMTTDLDASASTIQLTLTAFLVGIAVGQLVFGPLSDRFGRLKPLVVGAVLLVIASAVAALAPTVTVLIVARFVQGLTGAAGMVVGRAIVSDLASGKGAARAFSLMMLVGGVAPVLAPFVGSILVGPIGWRGILWVLAGLATLMLISVIVVIRESHPARARGARQTLDQTGGSPLRALGSRAFIANTVTVIFAFAVMMAYISASPFVYQVMIGFDEMTYGILFGVNAAGLVASSAVSARLTRSHAPTKILRIGMGIMVTATAILLGLTLSTAPAIFLPVPIFFAVASVGLVLGNATALALGAVPGAAGTASAVLGAAQFSLAALATPIVGIGGEDTALPMAITMFTAATVALAGLLAGSGRSPERPLTLG